MGYEVWEIPICKDLRCQRKDWFNFSLLDFSVIVLRFGHF
ncbi:hypothetical protein CWATWH8502_2382 [Crocosphaera watsonii WH 8502]|uniref:Uncharacterized protein n=1 Tax=Crocosphaera watsonii WH 8502 TaxID=423474 RepID=T2IE18_CROWT|nr:hypothetical protein CWATWH8502_2382 [Crocosphaera watsonii WH 8502]